MSVVRIAVPKSPKRIRVTDSDALLEHAKILQLRSRLHDLIDQELRPAEQRVEEARLKLREAEVAGEQVKLALEAISLEERKAIECFFALVRKSTPQMRGMAERYGGDVSFNFDSNGRSVWVVALFGKGAPAFTLLRRAQDRPFDWAQDRLRPFEAARSPFETPLWGSSARTESSLRDGPSSRLRTGPAGLLRVSGRGDGIPLDEEQDDEGNEEEG